MQQVAQETWIAFERRLEQAQVPAPQRPDYHKWTRFYLDFCQKYGHPPRSPASLGPFLNKLAARNQSAEQREQAAQAIRLLLGTPAEPGGSLAVHTVQAPVSTTPAPGRESQPLASRPVTPRARPILPAQTAPPPGPANPNPSGSPGPAPASGPVPGRGASWEKEYRELEGAIKLRNYSRKTFAAYRLWVGKFQAFVHSRPTEQLGTDEVRGFLTELAVRYGVAASTQNQAFNALLFFYRHVLHREFGQLDGVGRAKHHRYVPVVLSHAETEAVLGELQPPYRLVGLLLYGCGLRLMECVNLGIVIYLQTVPGVTLKEAKSPLDLDPGLG
jgi:Phage integrase, N-terminal SAM-like domain